jgi:hypothetical protein
MGYFWGQARPKVEKPEAEDSVWSLEMKNKSTWAKSVWKELEDNS